MGTQPKVFGRTRRKVPAIGSSFGNGSRKASQRGSQKRDQSRRGYRGCPRGSFAAKYPSGTRSKRKRYGWRVLLIIASIIVTSAVSRSISEFARAETLGTAFILFLPHRVARVKVTIPWDKPWGIPTITRAGTVEDNCSTLPLRDLFNRSKRLAQIAGDMETDCIHKKTRLHCLQAGLFLLKNPAIPTFALVGTIIGSESLTTVFGMGTGGPFGYGHRERATGAVAHCDP